MDLNEIRKKRQKQAAEREAAIAAGQQRSQNQSLKNTISQSGAASQKASAQVAEAVKESTDELKKSSETLVSTLSAQNAGVADALNNLVVATVMARDPKLIEVVSQFTSLLNNLSTATQAIDKNPLNELPTVNKELVKALQDFTKKAPEEKDYTPLFEKLDKSLGSLDLKPVINVPSQPAPVIKLDGLSSQLKDVEAAIKANKVDFPSINFDEVTGGLEEVRNTIANLSFPVPNYVLPFKDSTGKATQVQLDVNGNVPIAGGTGGGGGGDGAIVDGVSATIKATVVDYANANPLTVRLSDTNGDYVAAGAGTQYTEDAAASADPVGSMLMAVRRDTLSTSEVSADGDNIALKATNKGQLHVAASDALPVSNASLANLDVALSTRTKPADVQNVQQNASVIPTATTMQNAATANGNGTNLNVSGYATAVIDVTASVAMSGGTTINFEVSPDDTTWYAIQGTAVGGNTKVTTTTATGNWQFDVAGYKSLRARISAYSAGTITVKGYATVIAGSPDFLKIDPTGTTTQPVSIASMPSTPVTGTFWQATQPVSGTVTTTPPSNASTNVAQLAGTTTDTNSGTKSAGTLRVVLATDQPALTNKLLVTPDSVALPANQSVNASQINGVTPLMGNGVTGTGSQRVTIASDNTAFTVNAAQSGTWTVQPGNTPNTSPWLTTQTPKTSGGLTTFHLVSAGSTNATVVKASAGQVFGWYIYNSNAAARKLVFHNSASSPTAGASVFFAIVVPPASAANVEFTNGIAFSSGIGITTVTDLTDAGATAVAASDLIINVFYS